METVETSVYKRMDRAVYQTERAIVIGSLLVMSVVVFLDVLHRSFSGDDSKLAAMVAKVAGWVGIEILTDSPGYAQLTAAAPYALLVGFSALTYFGIRSTKRATPIAAPLAAVSAVVGVLVAYGLVRLFLALVPNGLVWSQDLALVLTLWVGFVGASMCTYENRHLRVEAVQRFLPAKIRPFIGFFSGLFSMAVCLGLCWVSIRYVAFHRLEYVSTSGQGGVVAGMDLPKYVGFAVLPLSFGIMSIRFFVKAIASLRGEVEDTVDPLLAAAAAHANDDAYRPSDVATEALPMVRAEARESAIDTMISKVEQLPELGVPQPQSKVPTDAHDILLMYPGQLVDPDETKELDEGPIQLTDDTRDLVASDLAGGLDDEQEPR